MDNRTLKLWAAGLLLGMPLGLGVAALIGGAWTVGIGVAGTVAVNLLGKD